QLGARDHPGDARTDDAHVYVVGNRIAPGEWRERVLEVVRERSLSGEVPDLGATRDHALLALLRVLRVDRFGIEAGCTHTVSVTLRRCGGRSGSRPRAIASAFAAR